MASQGLNGQFYSVRKQLVGELYFRVMRWLNKVLTVNSTVSVSSPAVGFPASDWSVMRIYPRFLRLIGPS